MDEKIPQREPFCRWGRGDRKTAEALKGDKIDEVRNCFEQWKNVSIGVLHQMESTLKVTEV